MEEKESECRLKSEKLDDMEEEKTLDYWEKWCEESINKLLNVNNCVNKSVYQFEMLFT